MRAANTYRAARRNACFRSRSVWGPGFLHPDHIKRVLINHSPDGKKPGPYVLTRSARTTTGKLYGAMGDDLIWRKREFRK